MDDLLLGYVLDALDPAETAAVEAHLRLHPDDAAKVDRLRRVLRPLEADRDGYDPPPGLAVATLGRVAEHMVAARSREPDPAADMSTEELAIPPVLVRADGVAPPRATPARGRPPLRRWAEVAVAAGIGFLAFGMVLAGVQKVRWDNQAVACQNNLRVMYQGLSGYADAHAEQFPQVGRPDAPTAGSFVTILVAADQCPDELKLVCPAAGPAPPGLDGFRPDRHAPPGPAVVARVGYAYTLGYRPPGGELVGLRRADADGYTPLAADLPARRVAPSDGPVSPHGRGQNVLYADGRVQFFTAATVGPNGDDIYRNVVNQVRAGLFPADAALGRATDEP